MKKVVVNFRKYIPYLLSGIYGGVKPKTTFQSFVMFWGYIPILLNFALANFYGSFIVYAISPKTFNKLMSKGEFSENWFFSPKNFMEYSGVNLIEYHLSAMSFNLAISLLFSIFGEIVSNMLGYHSPMILNSRNLILGIPLFFILTFICRQVKKNFISNEDK